MPKKPDKKKELIKELNQLFKDKCYKLYSNSCILCESLGLYHHYIMKSRNGLLKYEPQNAICLCNSHHYKIHNAPPTEVARMTEQIRKKKGKEWQVYIDEAEKTHGQSFNSLKWLEQEKIKLENI